MSNITLPVASGHYASDCAAGRDHANALLNHIRSTGQFPALGWALGRELNGVEVGFFQGIAEAVCHNETERA